MHFLVIPRFVTGEKKKKEFHVQFHWSCNPGFRPIKKCNSDNEIANNQYIV